MAAASSMRSSLRPEVSVTAADGSTTPTSSMRAIGEKCFVARSVNFPIRHEPVTKSQK